MTESTWSQGTVMVPKRAVFTLTVITIFFDDAAGDPVPVLHYQHIRRQHRGEQQK